MKYKDYTIALRGVVWSGRHSMCTSTQYNQTCRHIEPTVKKNLFIKLAVIKDYESVFTTLEDFIICSCFNPNPLKLTKCNKR